jgi:hypothetical protein
VIEYLYNLIDSLRLRSYKKIRHIKNKNNTQALSLLPLVTGGAFEGFEKYVTMRKYPLITGFSDPALMKNWC